MVATRKRCVRLGPDGDTPAKHWSAFSPARIAFTTPVSPIETQLRKVIPELCVNDVPERVAEVEISSANPVRGDPLPGWLQPFWRTFGRWGRTESWSCGRFRGYTGWWPVVAQRARARPLPQTPQLVCTLRTRSREIRCASQTSKTMWGRKRTTHDNLDHRLRVHEWQRWGHGTSWMV